jgi:hypothetical protein
MSVFLGAISKKKKMVLYKSFGKYLKSKNGNEVYIYDKGVLYDTDKFGKKTTSYRMSKIDLIIK